MANQNEKRKNTIVATSAAAPPGGFTKARIFGSAIAGISEIAIFHPVDTVAKRLMSTETRIVVTSASNTALNLNNAIFRESCHKNPLQKFGSLFPGIGFGAAYKVCQRVYKFGGQPVLKEKLMVSYGSVFEERFGRRNGRTMISAVSGSIIGVGEVFLLPLDALKVKAQTAPEQLRGRGVFDIFAKEGFSLYRGAGWTAARNAPGSFALFGGNAAAKSFLGVSDSGEQATWAQDAISSSAGAITSISVAQPLDVIKTRIQNKPFNSPESGFSIVKKLVKNEGIGGFFKGLTPKLLVVGPKLIFSFTIAQHTIAYFTQKFNQY